MAANPKSVNINVPKTITVLLTPLPERQKDVIMKRFGLKDGIRRTLEEIGGQYKITRERVRQIENDAKRALLESDAMKKFEPLYQRIIEHFKEHGGVRPEHKLFEEDASKLLSSSLGREIAQAYLYFLLSLHDAFVRHSENEKFHSMWALKDVDPSVVRTIAGELVKKLEAHGQPVTKEQLHAWLSELSGETREHVLVSHVAASKDIGENVYGEYGLSHWPEISTRGVRDKAYVVLKKQAKPMHFKDIVDAINTIFDLKKEAHPQTVHNELIKNNRFVLVGRGTYALSEWGYKPGKVSDVLLRILSQVDRPMSKDEIIKEVMKERNVKLNTILLNLQNKDYFDRTEDGKFVLKK